jgi:hypothetical protein
MLNLDSKTEGNIAGQEHTVEQIISNLRQAEVELSQAPGAQAFGLRWVGPFSDDNRGPMAAATSNSCPVLILPIYVVPTIDRNRELVWRESGQNSAPQSRVTGLPASTVNRAPVFGVRWTPRGPETGPGRSAG